VLAGIIHLNGNLKDSPYKDETVAVFASMHPRFGTLFLPKFEMLTLSGSTRYLVRVFRSSLGYMISQGYPVDI
jgi:hypothetical protein